jgi:hypothetical protein
MSKDEQLN